jgi:hypothetical protein
MMPIDSKLTSSSRRIIFDWMLRRFRPNMRGELCEWVGLCGSVMAAGK